MIGQLNFMFVKLNLQLEYISTVQKEKKYERQCVNALTCDVHSPSLLYIYIYKKPSLLSAGTFNVLQIV